MNDTYDDASTLLVDDVPLGEFLDELMPARTMSVFPQRGRDVAAQRQ